MLCTGWAPHPATFFANMRPFSALPAVTGARSRLQRSPPPVCPCILPGDPRRGWLTSGLMAHEEWAALGFHEDDDALPVADEPTPRREAAGFVAGVRFPEESRRRREQQQQQRREQKQEQRDLLKQQQP